MTNEQIEELLALEEKATPGPWEGLLRSKIENFRMGDNDRQFLYVMREVARELLLEHKALRGAMAADDERLRIAGKRTGLPFDCDTPEHMADELLFLRGEVERLRESAKQAQGGVSPEEREASREKAVLRTIFHDDGQIVTVTDRVED